MIRQTLEVQNRLGLHARAAAKLVQLVSGYHSEIRLAREGEKEYIDSRSILGILMLAASKGTRLTVSIAGEDEQEAGRVIRQLFEEKFGESE